MVLVYAWTEVAGTNLLHPSRTYLGFKGLCPQEKSKSNIKREMEEVCSSERGAWIRSCCLLFVRDR